MNASSPHSRAGFSLIEMIGVLAIMAILATVIVPNAVKSLDRAAIRAEGTNLANLGESLKLYVRQNAAPPNAANWTTQLGAYADLNPTELAVNKRNEARVFLLDPASTPAPRVLLLSVMRTGLTLPTTATTAQFDAIWNTADGVVPTASNWPGGWNAVANSADYLVIGRVNLTPIYLTDLQTYAFTLNNISGSTTTTTTTTGGGNGNNGNGNGNGNGGGTTTTTTTTIPAVTASFSIQFANGSSQAAVNIAGGATYEISPGLRAGDRINLFNAAGGVSLGYTYVVTDAGQTFDFNGSQWLPQ